MSSYSDFAGAASDILLKKGDALAQGKRASGELWGGTIANLGQVIPQQVQQAMRQAAERKKTAQIQQILQQNGGDLDKALPLIMGVDATIGGKLAKDHADVQKSVAEVTKIKQDAEKAQLEFSDRLWSQVHDEDSYARAALVSHRLGEEVPPQFDPQWVEGKKRSLLTLKDQFEQAKPPEPFTLSPGQKRFSPTGEVLAEVEKPAAEAGFTLSPGATRYDAQGNILAQSDQRSASGPNIGSFEDFVTRKYGANPTPEQVLAARKAYGQADDRPSVTVNMAGDDVNAIADAIIRGDQPPELTGLYRNAGPVRAALARKGYDQSTALTDWRATQKHVATLNGAQQTRMAQAIDNAAHSLDVIDGLADQWDGGKFPPLNKARLALAKNGALGAKAQQIATNLEAQISDVTSELGNVYMGGNSPTDHALGLAAKNLSADWTRDQLKSALQLARKNLTIRQNSMRNVGVAGASAGNPYAAPAPAAPPTAAPTAPGLSYQDYLKSKGGK